MHNQAMDEIAIPSARVSNDSPSGERKNFKELERDTYIGSEFFFLTLDFHKILLPFYH